MTAEELGELFPVVIEKYNSVWPELYQTEKKRIAKAFASQEIVQTDHIGSTAVPGLKAKPTIDILLQISERLELQKLDSKFQSLGYQVNRRPENPPPHLTFVKGYSPRGFEGQAYHLHIRYRGDWDEIRFRDYLTQHRDVANAYEALKLQLAEKYKNDREAYMEGKSEFIYLCLNKWGR
jgi:GrpB-like predicted nucleotidyltransferase (UPF0157 family)